MLNVLAYLSLINLYGTDPYMDHALFSAFLAQFN